MKSGSKETVHGDLSLEFGAGFSDDDVDRILEIMSDSGIRVENIDARRAET